MDWSFLFRIFQQFEALQGQDVNKEEEQIFKASHESTGAEVSHPNFLWSPLESKIFVDLLFQICRRPHNNIAALTSQL